MWTLLFQRVSEAAIHVQASQNSGSHCYGTVGTLSFASRLDGAPDRLGTSILLLVADHHREQRLTLDGLGDAAAFELHLTRADDRADVDFVDRREVDSLANRDGRPRSGIAPRRRRLGRGAG